METKIVSGSLSISGAMLSRESLVLDFSKEGIQNYFLEYGFVEGITITELVVGGVKDSHGNSTKDKVSSNSRVIEIPKKYRTRITILNYGKGDNIPEMECKFEPYQKPEPPKVREEIPMEELQSLFTQIILLSNALPRLNGYARKITRDYNALLHSEDNDSGEIDYDVCIKNQMAIKGLIQSCNRIVGEVLKIDPNALTRR